MNKLMFVYVQKFINSELSLGVCVPLQFSPTGHDFPANDDFSTTNNAMPQTQIEHGLEIVNLLKVSTDSFNFQLIVNVFIENAMSECIGSRKISTHRRRFDSSPGTMR